MTDVIRVRAELGHGHLALAVDGHEGHVEDGRVCAAVSAVTQTALLGLQEIARQHPDLIEFTIKEKA